MTNKPVMRVRTPDIVQAELKHLNGTAKHSWRKIAQLPEYKKVVYKGKSISPGTLSTIAKHGHIPKKWMKPLRVITPEALSKKTRRDDLEKIYRDAGYKSKWQFNTLLREGKMILPRNLEKCK